MAYIYSLAGDFSPAGIAPSQLQSEIIDALAIANTVSADGDTVIIRFPSILSGPDKSTLDSVVAAHVPLAESTGMDVSGLGTLYGTEGSESLFWVPEGGTTIDLTKTTVSYDVVLVNSTVTVSNTSYATLSGMTYNIPADGTYYVLFQTSLRTNNNSSICDIAFFVNGTEQSATIVSCGNESASYPIQTSMFGSFSSGDTITLRQRRSSGGGNQRFYNRQIIALRCA